jgi:serine/threonine-protein kinase
MPVARITDFVDLLHSLPLLSPEQQREVAVLLPHCPDARELARLLLERDWLTAFQANLLLQERGHELLLGSYLLLERLGEGGMGAVFKARHIKLGRIEALKVIRKERFRHPGAAQRFLREIEAIAKLSHPNVVLAYNADDAGDRLYFAMEYVEGIDLARLVRDQGAIPVAQACDHVRQAAWGLQHAFEQGLVHRDVKPGNLLLSRKDGVVKLLDLGLARLGVWSETVDAQTMLPEDGATTGTILTQQGAVMGTPDYMAPEQASAVSEVDIRADLYSLGCTFYFLLTGKVPFPGGSIQQKLERQKRAAPPDVSLLRPDMPRAIADMVRQLMAKRREDRFQTPAELALALETGPADHPVGTQPASQPVLEPAETLSAATPSETVLTPPAHAARRDPEQRLRLAVIGVGGLILAGLVILIVCVIAHQMRVPQSPPRPFDAEERAQQELADFLARRRDTAEQREALASDLRGFRMRHPFSRAALEAAGVLRRLPSPWDRLTPVKDDLVPGLPPEVVAYQGDRAGQNWGRIQALAFTSDGKLLASAGWGHHLQLWECTERELKLRKVLHIRAIHVYALAFLPDDRTLAVGTREGAVELWDVTTGQFRHRLDRGQPTVEHLLLTPDRRTLLASHENGVLHFWRVDGATPSHDGSINVTDTSLRALSLTPDGKTLWTADSHKKVQRWDLTTRRATPFDIPEQRIDPPCAFAPDGKTMGLVREDRVLVFDLATGKVVRSTRIPGDVPQLLRLSPDSTTLLIATRQRWCFCWNQTPEGELVRLKTEHPSPPSAVAWTPSGDRLATGCDAHLLRLWAWPEGRLLDEVGRGRDNPHLAAVTPDQEDIVYGTREKTVRLWNPVAGQPRLLAKETPYLGVVSAAPDGRWLAWSGGGSLYLGDRRQAAAPVARRFPYGTMVGWLSDTALLALSECQVLLCDWTRETTGVSQFLVPKAGSPVSLSANGQVIAAVASNAQIQIWRVANPSQRREINENFGSIRGLSLSPDGNSLGVNAEKGLWLFRLDDSIDKLILRNKGAVFAAAFSPDGRTLVASEQGSGRVSVWEVATGRLLKEIEMPGAPTALAYAPDSRHLITANPNETLSILRLEEP